MTDERPSKRRGWVRLGALALALVAAVVALELREPGASATPTAVKPAGGPLTVDVIEAAAEPHALEVTATGELMPAEAVAIVSELPRRLVRIRADEGAKVEKGAVLFEVDASDLSARYARLKVARDLAARILARREANAGTGAVSPHEIDVAKTEVEALDAEMREVATERNKATIRAPFAGVLGTRRVSEGAWLTPEVVIATLYDTSRYKIDFTLPERYASQLVVGAPFTFTTSGGGRHQGKIAVVEPSVDSGSRSARVRGVVDHGEGLVAGAFATVAIDLEPREAIFVPTIAVEASPAGHSLWVEREGRAEKRSVEIGERTSERIEILRGLSAGEKVIISNMLRLRPDAPVVPRQASTP